MTNGKGGSEAAPAAQTVADACAAWQGGRDGGSSPIRAAARVLTRTKHYFDAAFITDLERDAAKDAVTLSRARTLLDAVNSSDLRDAADWGRSTGYATDWAGRGIRSGPQDDQILAVLKSGEITMPLWGLSLDRSVAASFGEGFLFELHGPFPAVPAWSASGIKEEERELITGGRYAVTSPNAGANGTVIGLRYLDPISS